MNSKKAVIWQTDNADVIAAFIHIIAELTDSHRAVGAILVERKKLIKPGGL